MQLVTDPRVREAIDLSSGIGPGARSYGRTKIGQSLLLARRLIEAGVRYVACNEFNQTWDTHGDLAKRYKAIVPPMDQAFAALVEDLDARGLLAETLLINAGEFGRTPWSTRTAARPLAPGLLAILATGGVRGGQVYGSSDARGGDRRPAGVPGRSSGALVDLSRGGNGDRAARPAGPAFHALHREGAGGAVGMTV